MILFCPLKSNLATGFLLLAAYDDEVPGLELGVKRLIADGVIPAGVTYEAMNYSKTNVRRFERED